MPQYQPQIIPPYSPQWRSKLFLREGIGGFDLKRSVFEEVGDEVEYISFGDDFVENV